MIKKNMKRDTLSMFEVPLWYDLAYNILTLSESEVNERYKGKLNFIQ